MTLSPGDLVRCEITKWGDHPHWAYPGVYLGTDQHGDWIGFPEGTEFHRPGADYTAPYDQVGLLPHVDLAERGWMAAFHSPQGPVQVYVDIATPPVWDGSVVRSVDLDLDVVRGANGRVWVDDEDEFAQHRVSLGYPEELVRAACASCDHVHAAVRDRLPPYDGSHLLWLARLSALAG
ncbi:DUF402 domain-containing protein [Nocardioides sp. LHG3406-4]|uniref:DUF402 domain-containing protein n=1 Tax=Nocardioides sp. LHG3406-4 TaxID=2804575 RepID=UPI003CE7208F